MLFSCFPVQRAELWCMLEVCGVWTFDDDDEDDDDDDDDDD